MQLIVNVKQVGKRKNTIGDKLITLEQTPLTTAELIASVVASQVKEFNNRLDESELLKHIIYNKTTAKADEAIQNALQSFEDGIFRIFVGDVELTALEQPIALMENDKLTFIRLTMLAGRMW